MNWWKSLEKRERIVLSIGFAAIILAIGYFGMRPALDQYETSRAQLMAARSQLEQARRIHREVQELERERERVEQLLAARGSNYSLWNAVNRSIQTNQLARHAEITSQPNEMAGASAVRISLSGVSLEQLVELLYEIHSRDSLVTLRRVQYLRPALDGQGLDCDLMLITPMP